MSLRDALVAKGLASKKRAQEVERQLKAERKAEQGSRQRKTEQENAQAAAAREAAEAERVARAAERQAALRAREAHELRYRVRQLVSAHKLAARGPIPFHHRIGPTGRVGTLHVSESIGRELRAGRAAIAGYQDDGGGWTFQVVTPRAAERLAEIAPDHLMHWVQDAAHLADPAEALISRDWASGLGAHRVRDDAELRAWARRS